MAYVLLFLLLHFRVVFCVKRVTLDPSVVDLKPVNNAHFPNQTSNLYGTNVVGRYKWISKTGLFERDVHVENINDPKNMLFCPRSDQNPFMALYLKTSKNRRLVCKEKS
uniref:Uncharacterized protein n=1 Tax=Panagrolaimus sp. PS1159 TaxID=55785 RepID=A0AC35GG95_9BILA